MRLRLLIPSIIVLANAGAPMVGQGLEEYLRQAQTLAESSQFEPAIRVLETALEKHPDAPRLLLQLGSLLVRVGQFERGDKLLERALERLPFNPEALKNRAQARLKQGDLETAAELFRKSLWYEPDDAETHYRLAFTLFVKGDEKGAQDHSRRSVESDPLASHYRRFYSLLLEIAGQREESFRQLRMAHKLDPGNAQTLYRLSRLEMRLGNLGQAIEYADLASRQDPENPLYLEELAVLYEKAGDTEEARNARGQADVLAKAHHDYVKAIQLRREERLEEAVTLLEKAVQEHPEFPTAALLLADLYSRRGEDDMALEVYSRVLELDPSRSRAREESAWIHVRQGSVEAALDLFKHSDDPGLSRTFLEGYQHFLNERWIEALQRFRQVEEVYPLTPGLLQLISSCLDEMGRDEEAFLYLDKAAEIEPGDRAIQSQMQEIQFEKALRAQGRHDWETAVAILGELVAQESENSLYRLNQAYSLQRTGRLTEAVEAYRKGLEQEPSAYWARVNLATSLYLLTHYNDAAIEWERITSENPTPEALFQLGLCYSHLQRDPEAEVAFEKALKTGGESPELLYNLGITRLRLTKTEGAWALIQRAARQGYPPAVDFLIRARQ